MIFDFDFDFDFDLMCLHLFYLYVPFIFGMDPRDKSNVPYYFVFSRLTSSIVTNLACKKHSANFFVESTRSTLSSLDRVLRRPHVYRFPIFGVERFLPERFLQASYHLRGLNITMVGPLRSW